MEGILIPISNHPTLPLKRKVEVRGFLPWWPDASLKVFLMVKHFVKNEDDTYGDVMDSKSVVDYEDFLVASDVRNVDPIDGMECYSEILNEGTEQQETIWKRIDNHKDVSPPVGQFSFFDTIIRSYPVKVGEMLTHFVVLNDSLKGRWNK
jgi:hypothetical protein